jgi:hypothetical protein
VGVSLPGGRPWLEEVLYAEEVAVKLADLDATPALR